MPDRVKLRRRKHAVRLHACFQAKTTDVLTDSSGGEDRKKIKDGFRFWRSTVNMVSSIQRGH